MKQIALVLFLTAMAALGYKVTQLLKPSDEGSLSSGAERLPAASGNLQAPGASRPVTGQLTQELIPSPELVKRAEEHANFDWKAVADPNSVADLNDVRPFDFSQVDFEADVPFQIDGVGVPRDRLRAFALLDLGTALMEARLLRDLEVHRASQRGLDARLTNSERQRFFDLAAAAKNLTPDQFTTELARSTGLSPVVAKELRAYALEGTLAALLGLGSASELPKAYQSVMAISQSTGVMENSIKRVNEAWGEFTKAREEGGPELEVSMKKIADSLDVFALFGTSAVGNDLEFRLWTVLDTPDAPADFVGAVSAREFDSGGGNSAMEDSTPPWESSAPSFQIRVDDLWEPFSAGLSRASLEKVARDYVYYYKLNLDLQQRGIALSAKESWENYLEESVASRGTALGMAFLYQQLEGYPSLHHYRARAALEEGLMRSFPAGWDQADKLAKFFEGNRFFIERWQPSLSVAIFPAVDQANGSGVPDWPAALEKANRLYERASAGEAFSTLIAEHNATLVEEVRAGQGNQVAEELKGMVGSGATGFLGINQIDELLSIKRYDQLLMGANVGRSAAGHLEPGEVSKPWRTPVGYVVLRVEGARLGELEREYEDAEGETEYFFRESQYLNWVGEVLRQTSVVKN